MVFLEIGVGFNTPGIIKYSFWQEVYHNKRAFYACLNMEESPVPDALRDRAILLRGGADDIIRQLITKEPCDEV